jgi:hypothetical protein
MNIARSTPKFFGLLVLAFVILLLFALINYSPKNGAKNGSESSPEIKVENPKK